MLKYIVTSLMIVIVTGVLGYSVMTGAVATIARCIFWLSLVSLVIALLYDPKARNSEI